MADADLYPSILVLYPALLGYHHRRYHHRRYHHRRYHQQVFSLVVLLTSYLIVIARAIQGNNEQQDTKEKGLSIALLLSTTISSNLVVPDDYIHYFIRKLIDGRRTGD